MSNRQLFFNIFSFLFFSLNNFLNSIFSTFSILMLTSIEFFYFREWIFQSWNLHLVLFYVFISLLTFPVCSFITSIFSFVILTILRVAALRSLLILISGLLVVGLFWLSSLLSVCHIFLFLWERLEILYSILHIVNNIVTLGFGIYIDLLVIFCIISKQLIWQD